MITKLYMKKEIKIVPTHKQIFSYENTDTPYYTTYPPGGEWSTSYTNLDHKKDLTNITNRINTDAALYLHIPFCEKLCYFCFCYTKIIKDKNNDSVLRTIKNIENEINLYGEIFQNTNKPNVKQIQIGGGTPTYLSDSQFIKLFSRIENIFSISELDEFAIEIDPRTVIGEDIKRFNDIGVNRFSMGIQDFDPDVQKAINRIQPLEMVTKLIESKNKITSLNFDLIYGLPYQTLKSFDQTIDDCIKLNADRLSIYSYDHTPDIYNHHNMMDPDLMPSKPEKIEMFLSAAEKLINAGYEWVGVDHFAKKSDKLSVALQKGQLGRTLNGYSTFREFDTEFGLGPSAISSLPSSYVQNIKDLKNYNESIEKKLLPVLRGWKMDEDDLIRREVIMHIILYGYYPFDRFLKLNNQNILQYFDDLHIKLNKLYADKLISDYTNKIQATGLGKYYIYHIAKIFDKYTKNKSEYIRTHAAVKMLNKIKQ